MARSDSGNVFSQIMEPIPRDWAFVQERKLSMYTYLIRACMKQGTASTI